MKQNKTNFDVLLIESDKDLAKLIETKLKEYNHKVNIAYDSREFHKCIQYPPEVIILSMELQNSEQGSVELFKYVMSETDINSKVIIYSVHDKKPWINEIFKIGQYHIYGDITDYSPDKLVTSINNSFTVQKQEADILNLQIENIFLKKRLVQSHPFIGESDKITRVKNQLVKMAKADEDVFLIGETGTGKEVAAYFYYLNSMRFSKAFQTVNCSALTENLIESELFGHVKGSFTSADKSKTGLFERCNGGTLFLDEITNLSLGAQAKILRAIENQEIQVVGGESKKVDTKLIFASNSPLNHLRRPDVFRKDLFYRIEGNIIELPNLIDRDKDIVLLMNHFLTSLSPGNIDHDYYNLSDLIDLIMAYSWPGNVRELKNFCKSVLLNESRVSNALIKKHLEKKISHHDSANDLPMVKYLHKENLKDGVSCFERDYLLHHLNKNKWQISKTADKIGIERTTLYKKMKLYNLCQK